MTDYTPTIPGLDLPQERDNPLTAAAIATIAALDEENVLREQDALTVQLILGLSKSLGADMAKGKITVAMSQATKQLLDAIATLPRLENAPTSTDWDKFQAELTAAREIQA